MKLCKLSASCYYLLVVTRKVGAHGTYLQEIRCHCLAMFSLSFFFFKSSGVWILRRVPKEVWEC